MPELYNAIAIHYGDYAREDGRRHPIDEDMYIGRHMLRDALAMRGISLVVTHRTSAVSYDTHDRLPDVEVDLDPVFMAQPDGSDKLVGSRWALSNLASFALVLDRDVQNFDNRERTSIATSYGSGLPNRQVVNHYSIHEYGNQKVAKMLPVLQKCGISAPTYRVGESQQLYDTYGDTRVITKPPDAALGQGVVIHRSRYDLKTFIDQTPRHAEHILQPFMDMTQPIPGLRPLTARDAELLAHFNSRPDRAREVGYNFGIHTDLEGKQHFWAFPVLRAANKAGELILGSPSTFIGIEPEDTPEQRFMLNGTRNVARTILEETGAAHLYGRTDFAWARGPRANEPQFVSFDANMRSPYLAPQSRFARQAFIDMAASIVEDNLLLTRNGGTLA